MVMFILSTGSLHSYGLDRVFALARAAGFDGIEVIVDARWDTRQAHVLRALSDAHRLPVTSLHSPFVLDVEGWEDTSAQRVQRTMALARELGVGLVVAHLPFRWHWLMVNTTLSGSHRWRWPMFWPRDAEYARWLLAEAIENRDGDGPRLLVENMPARRWWGGLRLNPYRLNSQVGLRQFPWLVLDTTHVGTFDADLLAFYESVKTQVAHVHLSDFDGREHRLPGTGRLPLAALLHRLAADDYQAAIVVETGPTALHAGGADSAVQQALEMALCFCRENFLPGTPSCSHGSHMSAAQ